MAGGAPTESFPAGQAFYRVHRATRSPAYFDTGPYGRFNPPPTHAAAFGTMYLSTTPQGAFIESLGRTRHIPTDDIDLRQLTRCTFDHQLRMFRVSSSTNRFRYDGIDLGAHAVATTTDYTVPQQLAARVWEDPADSFDGLSYAARHDNTHTLVSLAVFGEPGSHEPATVFADHKTDPIPADLVQRMVDDYGFEVIAPTPLP